jgi:peptidoglycan/xylan/chitin deacetylase (PgdA/CDA1 family)
LGSSLPVLMYHAIHPDEDVLSIHPDIFKHQISWLNKNNFRVISLVELAEHIKHKRDLPEKTIALTFDDGFRSIYDFAFPVLQEFGFSATVFLVAGYCEKTNDWPGQPAMLRRRELLDWDQILQMDAAGIEFGAHTLTHLRLDQQPDELVEREILESKYMIEDVLGHPIYSFAYPYGRTSDTARQVVGQNFSVACGTHLGLVGLHSDPIDLERVEIYYLKNSTIFRGLDQGWFPYYLALRRFVRQLSSIVSRREWT